MSAREVTLVTGANTGLGFQIIRALCGSDRPYDILLGGRSLSKVEQAITSITQEFPSSSSKVWPIQIDIEDDNSIQKAFEEVQSNFGRLDALINNAGKSSNFDIPDAFLIAEISQAHNWISNLPQGD